MINGRKTAAFNELVRPTSNTHNLQILHWHLFKLTTEVIPFSQLTLTTDLKFFPHTRQFALYAHRKQSSTINKNKKKLHRKQKKCLPFLIWIHFHRPGWTESGTSLVSPLRILRQRMDCKCKQIMGSDHMSQ